MSETEHTHASTTLLARHVVTPEGTIDDAAVQVRAGTLQWIGPRDARPDDGGEVVDLGDTTLLPGFIDVHIHGFAGQQAHDSPDALADVASHLASAGTTSFLPTVAGVHEDDVLDAQLDDMGGRIVDWVPGDVGSRPLGVHLEGPFLCGEGPARGSQSVDAIRPPTIARALELLAASRGTLSYMTIAPERDGAFDVIERLASENVRMSAGHSLATFETIRDAMERGVGIVCHTFNGMTPMHHREPGLVGAALTLDGLTVELIGDGQHVGTVAMDVLYRCRGADAICIITDNTQYAGMPDGRYPHHSGGTLIKEGNKNWVEGGTLSGSVTPMNEIVRNVRDALDLDLETVSRMASGNPARTLGIDDRKGRLEVGLDADVIAVGPDLEVRYVMLEGRPWRSVTG